MKQAQGFEMEMYLLRLLAACLTLGVVACADSDVADEPDRYRPTAEVVTPATETEVRRILLASELFPFSFHADGTFVFQSTGPQQGTYTVERNRLCMTRGVGSSSPVIRCRLVTIGPNGPGFSDAERPDREPSHLPM